MPTPYRWHLPWLSCALLLFYFHPALSQETDEEIKMLRAVDVREILPESVSSAPGAASILTDQEVEQLRPFTMTEALDFIPGVVTVQDDVLNRRANIGIRGSNPRRSRKVLLLEDGMPVNAATYLDPDAHYTPPMERLERIDVLKGTGQIMHGPLNNHGIINFRNKRPTLTPETTAEFALGDQSAFKRHLMHRNTIGDVGFVLSYSGAQSDGVFDTEEIEFNDVFGSVHWNPVWNHELSASFTYHNERSKHDERNLTPAEFSANPRGKLRLNEGAEFNNFNIDYYKGQLTHNFQVTDRLNLSSSFFASYMERPRLESRNNGPANGGHMVGRLRDYRNFGLETRAEYGDVDLFGLNHTFRAGLRGERQLFNDNRSAGQIGEALDADNPGDIFATNPADGRQISLQASAVSLFIEDSIRFGDWTVTPGVRLEYFSQKRNTKFRPGRAPSQESDYNSPLLPGISFLYEGFADTQVFASVNRGYSPAIARSDEFPLIPETGINSQLGLRTSLFQGASLELAGFYNMLQNTIVKAPFTNPEGFGIFNNGGDSESYGVDIGLRIDSNAYYSSPYNVFAMAAYNYTEAKFTEGSFKGNDVPQIPNHSGNFTLGLEHTAGWQVSATVSHLGGFFTDEFNTRGFTTALPPGDPDFEPLELVGRVASNTLISARASYLIPGSNVTIWAQGRNLTDRLYVTELADGLRPGAERSFLIGVQAKFY